MDAAVKGEKTSSSLEHVPLRGSLADQPHTSSSFSGGPPHSAVPTTSRSRSSDSSSSTAVGGSSSCESSAGSTDGSEAAGCRTEPEAAAPFAGRQQQQQRGSSGGTEESPSGAEAERVEATADASAEKERRQERKQQSLQQVAAAEQGALPVERATLEAAAKEAEAAAAADETRAAGGGQTFGPTAADAAPAGTDLAAGSAAEAGQTAIQAGGAAAARDAAVAAAAVAASVAAAAAAAATVVASGSASAPAAEGEAGGAGEGAVATAAEAEAGIKKVGAMITYGTADTDASRVAAAAAMVGAAAEQQQQPQPQDAFGATTSRAAASRKRKADVYLPDGDAETMDRLKKKLESLTKEQMKILLAKACVQYPAVEMALNSIIEADPASRRLMIRNVAFTTTEQALREKLESFGEIEDFKLVVERTSGQNKGFAFVTYRAMESVQHILNEQVVVDGRHLQVKLASQQDPINAFKRSFPGVVPSCRLFVRNVPDTCDDERLRDEFSVFGEIREAVIIRSKEGKSKGYGFVVFEEPEALMKATCQSQRVIDGQVTFVSVASETPRRNGQQHQQQAQLRGSPAAAVPGAAGWPLGTTPLAATANPYVQQMAALSPSLYMQQYQQHFMTASQVNAAVAAVTAQQQQPGVGAAAAQALQQHAQHGGLR